MKKQLYVMVGSPGLGKSTWIKNHLINFDGIARVISRDDIRFHLVKPDEDYFSKENQVFNEYIENLKLTLHDCDSTIADATHLNEGSRNKLLRALGTSLKDVEINAIVIKGSLDTALERNENRAGTRSYVPRSVVQRMWHQQTMPSLEEGFDKIYIYQSDKIGIKYTIIERDK